MKRPLVIVLGIIIAVGAGSTAMVVAHQSSELPLMADPANSAQVAAGKLVYAANCAGCHGINLEGQPNWMERKPDGKLPAPPHDATGHTWHHPDDQLFKVVKLGIAAIVPNYPTDMIGFGGRLSDQDIWNVLAYIKSKWPPDIQAKQAKISRAAANSDAAN